MGDKKDIEYGQLDFLPLSWNSSLPPMAVFVFVETRNRIKSARPGCVSLDDSSGRKQLRWDEKEKGGADRQSKGCG